MRLAHLTNKRILISRMVADTYDRLILSTVTATYANIQPTNNSGSEIREGVFGKAFRVYVDGGTDIQPGDRLKDIDTDETYQVLPDGVSRRTLGSIDYTLISVQKTKS